MTTQQNDLNKKPATDSLFPKLSATTLAGRKINFPDDIKDRQTFLVLVFEDGGAYEEAQAQADGWTIFWEDSLRSNGIDFYEIPMMSGRYKWVRFWVDGGMRSGIPKEKHDNVACFYGDKNKYMALLGITELRKAHVFLIDKNGRIKVQVKGEVNAASINQFMASNQQN